jgi:serine O-acetyltransferase
MMLATIRADITRKKRWYRRDQESWTSILHVLFAQGTIAVMVYRYGHWAHHIKNPLLKVLFKLPYWLVLPWVVSLTQIRISVRAKIGKGFVIHGFSGIIITDATIGENCTVNQQVTIGRGRPYRGTRREKLRPPPRLGDNVFLAAGAKVIGDVVVGNNVVVGPNSVVIASVPDNCTLMGVPAKIVLRNTRWLGETAEHLDVSQHPQTRELVQSSSDEGRVQDMEKAE